MLCVGSSLEVYPVAELPAITLTAGGRSRSSPGARRRSIPAQRSAAAGMWSMSSQRLWRSWGSG